MALPKILVVQCAALGHDLVESYRDEFGGLGLDFGPLTSVFPAVTCTAQASFRTGLAPEEHGMVANGLYQRDLRRIMFWEQSAGLVQGPRIWDAFRERGGRVGEMFWQQSLGDRVDMVLSPAPIHKHHGGMIQDCYAKPNGLYVELCAETGKAFNLMHYWGPLASAKSTRWITDATCAVMARPDAPDLLLTYLPHLDYALQKHGPQRADTTLKAVRELTRHLARLAESAKASGYELVVWGDYAMAPAETVVHPNRLLKEASLFAVREVAGRQYPDLYTSRAVAMADHQAAHLFVDDPEDVPAAKACLDGQPGIASVEIPADAHPNAGQLVLTANEGAWFSYKWWEQKAQAPDYATHVDIHSKIGFDPCELFFGWPPGSISLDDTRVGGTHGRADKPAAFATTLDLPAQPKSLLELSQALAGKLG